MSALVDDSNSQMSERTPIREGHDSEVPLMLNRQHYDIDPWQGHFTVADFISVRNEASNVSPADDMRVDGWALGSSVSQRLQHAKAKIEKLAETAGYDNWDGEGSDKITGETISLALRLIQTFPYSDHPNILGDDLDIDATPFGSIDFGWALERAVRMNVMALSSGEVAFAYSVYGRRDSGKESWTGNLPYSILEAFDSVFGRTEMGG